MWDSMSDVLQWGVTASVVGLFGVVFVAVYSTLGGRQSLDRILGSGADKPLPMVRTISLVMLLVAAVLIAVGLAT